MLVTLLALLVSSLVGPVASHEALVYAHDGLLRSCVGVSGIDGEAYWHTLLVDTGASESVRMPRRVGLCTTVRLQAGVELLFAVAGR